MRILRASIVATLMLALVAIPSMGQDVTPPDEYRAALVAYDESAIESDGTVVSALAQYQDGLDRIVAEQERLAGIVPDECYADVHERYIEYVGFGAELQPDMLEQLEQATTMWDLIPWLLVAAAEMEARFPEFFVFPDPDASPEPGVISMGSGAEADYLLAFDTLNTCEGIEPQE